MTGKNGRILLFGGKVSCLKRVRYYETGEEGGRNLHSFAW